MTNGRKLKSRVKIFGFLLIIFFLGCSDSSDLPTPEKIGIEERTRLITGRQAAQIVNKMHGTAVAGHNNVIAEYGRDKKDFLFVTYYTDQTEAQKAFRLMIEKMTAAKNSPFIQLSPLGKYQNKVYTTLGMGAIHYIYHSGNFLLWFQTYQSFGDELPAHLLELYPL